MRVVRTSSLWLLFVVYACAAAHAAPIYYSTVAANVTYHGVPPDQDADSALVNNSDNAPTVTAALAGASAFASVTDAVLHAFATTPGSGASANASASFFDTLLLTSPTLANGTAVQLFAEMQFSRTVTPNGVGIPCIGGSVAYAGIDFGNSAGRAGSVFVQDHTCDNSDINNPIGLIQGIIGQELTLNAFLNAGVGALSAGTADAANTFRFFVTPVGDFSYTAASGNTYVNAPPPTAVPEPSTVLLLGSGLSLAFSRVRRRFGRQ